jgi:hypothetical protein
MKLDIQGFTKMHKSNQKFSKWMIFDATENDERYQLCARDKSVHDKEVNAIAIGIYKEPVREVAVAENVYLIKIAYNEFDNEIWKGYVRLSTIKNKSEFFKSMLNTITEYENKNK